MRIQTQFKSSWIHPLKNMKYLNFQGCLETVVIPSFYSVNLNRGTPLDNEINIKVFFPSHNLTSVKPWVEFNCS